MNSTSVIDKELRAARVKNLTRILRDQVAQVWEQITPGHHDKIHVLWEDFGVRCSLHLEDIVPWDSCQEKEGTVSFPNAFMKAPESDRWEPLRCKTKTVNGFDVMGVARELFCLAVLCQGKAAIGGSANAA